MPHRKSIPTIVVSGCRNFALDITSESAPLYPVGPNRKRALLQNCGSVSSLLILTGVPMPGVDNGKVFVENLDGHSDRAAQEILPILQPKHLFVERADLVEKLFNAEQSGPGRKTAPDLK